MAAGPRRWHTRPMTDPTPTPFAWRLWLKRGALALVALLVVAQLVPYGRDHAKPTGGTEPRWDSARTKELFAGACADCHSDTTSWPPYASVAPISWLVQSDVDGGRSTLNVDHGTGEVDDMAEAIRSGGMPPIQYRLIHGRARLSDAEKQELIAGLRKTFGG